MRSLFTNFQGRWRQFRASRKDAIPLDVRLAGLRFRSRRGDYYRYIGDSIEATQGRKKFRQIFQQDAQRYERKPRGVLSRYWAQQFEGHGGRFDKVFAGTLPHDDVLLLRMLQDKGGDAILPEGLRDLSDSVALNQQAQGVVLQAVVGFILPLSAALTILVSVPLFSSPRIQEAAQDLPRYAWPSSAANLVALGDFMSGYALMLVAGLALAAIGIGLSMTRLTGRLRRVLDRYGLLWAIHRDFEAVRFLSNLALVLKTRNSKSVNLKESLYTLLHGANAYKADLIRQMLHNLLQRGKPTQEVFNVGLLSESMQFDLEDLIESRGLNAALEYLRPRLEKTLIRQLQRRAKLLMWVTLLSSLGIGLSVFMLQMTALREVQEAAMRFSTSF
jgi:hypothetical protein